jgi:hypothetical protein
VLAWLPVATQVLCEPARAQAEGWTDAKVCRAGIAAILLHPAKDVQPDGTEGAVHYYLFRRQSDRTVWRFKCRVDGERILWGSVWEHSEGLWRVNEYDGRVVFAIEGETVTIRQYHPDGSESVNHYRRTQL